MAYNKRQRHHPEGNDEQKTKRRYTAKSNLRLTDLNDDVLFEICLHLSFEDLIVLFKVSHMFVRVCCRSLSRIVKGFNIDKMKIPLGSSGTDFQRSVILLRCFGKFLSSVTVDYACLDIARAKQIHNLFVESCHESVTEIQFTNYISIWDITKCFPKLKTLIIHFGCVQRLVLQIGVWFPRVEYLLICSYTNIADTMNAVGTIPSLKNVWIHSYPVQDMNEFLVRNPQLKMFYLNSCEYFESNAYNVWATNAVDNVRNYVEMSVTFKMRDIASVRQLMIPEDRVAHLNLKEFYCRPIANCDFVTNYFNLKTFEFTKCLRPYQSINVHDLFTTAIQPLLERCKKLHSFKVTYQRNRPNTIDSWKNMVTLKTIELFDIIETHVQFSRWVFLSKVSTHGVLFMLNKPTHVV